MYRLVPIAALLALGGSASAQERVISTSELTKRMVGAPAQWNFTLIDARTAVEYGEAHIPGAVNIAASKTAKRLPEVVKEKDRTVVFYCNGPNCTKTVKAAKAALAAGYADVWEYKDGLPGWGKAGRPFEGKPLPAFTAAPVAPAALKALQASASPPVVVDIRDAEEFETFRIDGAKSIPIDDLEGRIREIPVGAAIVIADHAGHQAPVAARLLASLGRKQVSRLDGGVLKWQAAGLPVAKGK